MAIPKSNNYAFKAYDHSQIPMAVEQWPVIIIGSSMVGKTLGLLLGYLGIKSVSFDRHSASATHPRSAGLNIRTCEILRQLNLEQTTVEQSGKEYDINAGMLMAETLIGGKILGLLQHHEPEELKRYTPSRWVWISQAMFEPILGDNAGRFNSAQRHGYDVVHYEEHPEGVEVIVKNVATGTCQKYKASYMIACDGSQSATREKEEIRWEGPGYLQNCLNIRFEADLSQLIGNRVVHGVVHVSNPSVQGGFRLENGGKNGLFIVSNVMDRTSLDAGNVTPEQAKGYYYEGAGIDDSVDVQITDSSIWPLAAYNADRLTSRGGRVLVAGDAAHVMPPTGGFGGNCGIADAHNLAWKLAYVLNGRASPKLLETYNTERQPINNFTVGEAYKRFLNRLDDQKPQAPQVMDIAVELGYRYSTGAIVTQTGYRSPEELWDNPREPSALPGSRFPHVSLLSSTDPDQCISSLDLVIQNFVLLAVDAQSPWLAAAGVVPLDIDAYILHESSSPFRDSGKLADLAPPLWPIARRRAIRKCVARLTEPGTRTAVMGWGEKPLSDWS